MNKSVLLFLSCNLQYLIVLVLYFGLLTSHAQQPPKVTFHYTYIPFDRWCSKSTNTEIKEEWIKELYAKINLFEDAWNTKGSKLLKVTVEEVGKPFDKKELQATMTLCRSRSMSHPLLLGMKKYLSSATANAPKDKDQFIATVFHEVLHIYVFDILKKKQNIPLLEKYKHEPGSVRNHLHLMALLKNAYLKLGLEEELKTIIDSNKKIGSVYLRSWEIVNNEEHYKTFIEELSGF